MVFYIPHYAKEKVSLFEFVGRALSIVSLGVMAGCSDMSTVVAPRTEDVALVEGPPIQDVSTPFDDALECMNGRVSPGIVFAVGQVVDATGKETYADGGSGKFISQGAGEMVQSALFRAGVTVVNRRDPNIAVVETQWGIRDIQSQVPVNFYISGSINSLDFIPGGGATLQIAGVGPRYRQNRILIGLDLTMTDAFSGKIVASIPLQKQIFSSEFGGSVGRFFGDTLVNLDLGGQQREAVHFALRQMLNLATFELVSKVISSSEASPCVSLISPFYGSITTRASSNPQALQQAIVAADELKEKKEAEKLALAQAEAAKNKPVPPPVSIEQQLSEVARQSSIFAARAIAAAEESLATDSPDISARKAAEAMQLVARAVQFLRRGAEMGLKGAEGDAAAVVVERALKVSQLAAERVAKAVTAPPTPAPQASPAPEQPAAPESTGAVGQIPIQKEGTLQSTKNPG